MDMHAYKKEMIAYIKSLSADELEKAIIAAGAKRIEYDNQNTIDLKPINSVQIEFKYINKLDNNFVVDNSNDIILDSTNYNSSHSIEFDEGVLADSTAVEFDEDINNQNYICNFYEYGKAA